MSKMDTVDIKEAARLLGFKSTSRLSQKAKRGQIPGAFKLGRQWMFIVEKLVDFIYAMENENRKAAQIDIGDKKLCQSAKRKTVLTITRDSQFAESECKSQLKRLLAPKRRNMRTNEERKSENSF